MSTRPTARSHASAKPLKDCPRCGSALGQVAAPTVRLVSSLQWSYPVPYAGQKCPSCGWQVA